MSNAADINQQALDAYVATLSAQRTQAEAQQAYRDWLQSPAYWRLVWAGQVAAGLHASPVSDDTAEVIAGIARSQADTLVAEMFVEVPRG